MTSAGSNSPTSRSDLTTRRTLHWRSSTLSIRTVLVDTLKQTVVGWRPLPISFDSLTVLPRKPVAPMLARPNVTIEILQLHKEVFDVLPPNSTSEYHRPKAWQPHVTLARDISPSKLGDAIAAVLERWSAFETTLDQVALVYFKQRGTSWHVQEVWRAQL